MTSMLRISPAVPPVVCESRLVSPGKQCKLYQVVKGCNQEFFHSAAKQNIDTRACMMAERLIGYMNASHE